MCNIQQLVEYLINTNFFEKSLSYFSKFKGIEDLSFLLFRLYNLITLDSQICVLLYKAGFLSCFRCFLESPTNEKTFSHLEIFTEDEDEEEEEEEKILKQFEKEDYETSSFFYLFHMLKQIAISIPEIRIKIIELFNPKFIEFVFKYSNSKSCFLLDEFEIFLKSYLTLLNLLLKFLKYQFFRCAILFWSDSPTLFLHLRYL